MPILLLILVLLAVVLMLVLLLLHSHGLLRLPPRLRVWWDRSASNPKNDMPKDVREYIIRSNLQASLDGAKTRED
jgi:hypothetical protein